MISSPPPQSASCYKKDTNNPSPTTQQNKCPALMHQQGPEWEKKRTKLLSLAEQLKYKNAHFINTNNGNISALEPQELLLVIST